MNPQSNETAEMQLPPPMVEQGVAPAGRPQAEAGPAMPERPPSAVESAAGLAQPQPVTMQPPPQPPMPPAVPMPTMSGQPASAAGGTTNLVASDDTDLIEKEWVHKAKAIVERTRDDPYKQSEELTMVKADYLKKRYNKTIKLSK